MSQGQSGGETPATLHQLFATPLIEARPAGLAALIDPLRETILARKGGSKGIARSNIHGWHSDTDMLEWGGEAARALALETMKLCGRYTRDVNAEQGRSRYEMGMEMWANVSPAGASNQLHAHPSAFWSGVFYIDDGGDTEEGALVLQDPRFPMTRMYASDLVFADRSGDKQLSQHWVRPEPGKLILFPSWLMHAVRPHKGARDRISIAMNISAHPTAPGAG